VVTVLKIEQVQKVHSMGGLIIGRTKYRDNKTPRNIDNNGEAESLYSYAQCLVFLIFRGLTFRVMPDFLRSWLFRHLKVALLLFTGTALGHIDLYQRFSRRKE
jgi:hypothetical protein